MSSGSPCGGGIEYLHRDPTSRRRRESQGTWTQERLHWQGPAAHTKDRPVLSSERAPHNNKTVTVIQVIKIWSSAPNGCFIPRQTGRLTVGRNIKLNSTQMSSIVAYSLERVCLATGCLRRIRLRGKVFIESLPSSRCIRHNIILLGTPSSSKKCLFFRFSSQVSVCVFFSVLYE
jgi:hypothetical protein